MMTQEQIDQAGEAFNDAIGNNIIPRELRNRLVADLRSPSVGNAELIAGARKVRGDSRTKPEYIAGLDAYIAALVGSEQQPQPPIPAIPSAPSPPAPVVSVPVPGASLPYGPIMRFTAAEAKELGSIFIGAATRGAFDSTLAQRIASETSQGIYTYFESQKSPPGLGEFIRDYFYNRAFASDKSLILRYLAIIDQRGADNSILARGDQRVVIISGLADASTAPVPVPVGTQPIPAAPTVPASQSFGGAGNPNGSVEKGDGEGELVHRSNLNGSARQSGHKYQGVGRTDINGWDWGYRSKQNYQHEGTPELPYAIWGGNSHATWEYSQMPAAVDVGEGGDREFGDSRVQTDPTHPLFRWYRGQGFVIDQGQQPITDYGSSQISEPLSHKRRLMIGTQRERWPIVLVVSPVRPSADGSGKPETGLPVNWGVAWCDADGGPNPWRFVIGGRLRRLVAITLPDGREVVGLE